MIQLKTGTSFALSEVIYPNNGFYVGHYVIFAFLFRTAPNQAWDLSWVEFIIIIPQWNLAQITCGVEIYYRFPRSYRGAKGRNKSYHLHAIGHWLE